jgi:imidazolonepropionase-like amidohydrolase
VTLKNVVARSYQAMRFPGAPRALKMACGENPKRVYGSRNQSPVTRMGNVAGYRQAFADAQEYQRSWREYRRKLAGYEQKKSTDKDAEPPTEPKRDLKMETLVEVLEGRVLVQMHCYRADEMMTMLDVAKEFGFRISAFHHGVEAYKIADQLAQHGVCGALWADWWGFKMESYDGIQENLALVDRPAGGCAIVHSDSEEGIQRLNQEAAKVMVRGGRAGLDLPAERVIRWVTSNPAKALGIADRVGTLEAGKMADVVVWNRDPFSVYALAQQVFIDGALVFDREHPAARPRSDFLLGQPGWEGAR